MIKDNTSDDSLTALGESVPVTHAGREVLDNYVEHFRYRNAFVHEDQLTLAPEVLLRIMAEAARLEDLLRSRGAR